MRTRRVRAGEVVLEVLEAGEGGRPLLMVHGFQAAKDDFTDHLDRLGELGWHTVVADLRGHGGSDKPDDESAYGLDTFAADLVALADTFGWERFALFGHSMGGMVVQHLALAHPDRVAALVLMGTSHGPVEGIDPALLALGRQVVRDGGMQALVETQRELGPSPLDTPASIRLRDSRPGWAEFGERKVLACAPAMWLRMTDELFVQPERLGRLARLEVPVLVIAGQLDGIFLGACQRMAEAIPGAELVVIPEAGHSPMHETPDAYWEALSGFLGRVAADVRA